MESLMNKMIKKLILSTFFFFLLFVPFAFCDSPASLSEQETNKIDRTIWWSSKEDDPGLRKRFEELNTKYFEGDLKVKYIRYGHGLIKDGLTGATYYWNKTVDPEYAGQSVITVDEDFIANNPGELDGVLLHEMCHVFANMHDKDAEISGIDGHTLATYKIMIKYLVQIGANPRLGEGVVKTR